MDIYDLAYQMERDAMELYQSLAAGTEHPGIRDIFTKLAEDEENHADALKNLREEMKPELLSPSVQAVNTIFREIRENAPGGSLGGDLLSELRRALEIERKGMKFYKEQFEKLDTEDGQKLFQILSGLEEHHYTTIGDLIELVEEVDEENSRPVYPEV